MTINNNFRNFENVTLTPLNNVNYKDNVSNLNIRQDFIKLSSPLELFGNIRNNQINFFNVNKEIIEGNISSKTIQAVKNIPGDFWIGKLRSNGNREVAIIVPNNIDKNKPVEILYYFHGHNGTIDKALSNNGNGFSEELKEIAQRKNLVIVIPQGPPKQISYTWMRTSNGEDIEQFQNETINIIKTKLTNNINISKISVYGHSAGGQPIMNATLSNKLKADKITFLDASYGTWASKTYHYFIKQNPNVIFNIVYIPGTSTEKDVKNLQGKKGVITYISKYNHGLVPKKFIGL
ncbi:MAG: hypothetical protein KatS3mg068_0987 [Candidatus Sericytochromatia bacterium]|nr:MAG: hypothetical protein KatS3mg068_0987 [Candidatus Sericytochromatia bacterium]